MPGASKRLGWWLVFSVVFADIGTSVFYVAGYLHASIGNLAALAQIVTIVVFAGLALKYASISARCPDGGGVVSISQQAFPRLPSLSLVGGAMISVSYFLTSSMSAASGIHYLRGAWALDPALVVPIACAVIVALLVLNIVGLKESATVAATMAVAQLAINTAIVVLCAIYITAHGAWSQLLDHVFRPSGVVLTPAVLMRGYAETWLAYSGLESGAQLSESMKQPVRRTATIGMWLVIVVVSLFSPALTAFSTFLLPQAVKADPNAGFIAHLAGVVGGQPFLVLTVVSATLLLFMACNTALVGNYHVNLRLVQIGFLPPGLATRNLKFGTPHWSIAFSALVPVGVIAATRGQVGALGDLYSFGLLGTLAISSGCLDLIRWREGWRGPRYWFGVFTTVCIGLAWVVNWIQKVPALVFGAGISGLIVVTSIAYKRGWIGRFIPQAMPRPDLVPLTPAQLEALAKTKPGASKVLTVEEALDLMPLERSTVLVALRGFSPRLMDNAAMVAKGLGQRSLYTVVVDEVPGLFYRSVAGPSGEALGILQVAESYLRSKHQLDAIPIWRISNDSAVALVDAAEKLAANAVVVGTSRRSALWHLLRGHVVKGLAEGLPRSTRLIICN